MTSDQGPARKPRYKDPHQVIAELEALYRLGWRREVFISDDNFIGNLDQARAILTRLIPWMQDRGEPFSFWTQTSVNLGQHQEMIDLLTAANFGYVFLGVETPDPEILSRAHKYQNVKNPLGQSLAAINANGLSMVASFVIGFDGEKPGAGDRICEFVEELGIPVIMLNLLQPLPNTKLWERLKKEQRLLPQQTDGDFHGLQFNYLPSRPQEEILAEYVRAIDRMYDAFPVSGPGLSLLPHYAADPLGPGPPDWGGKNRPEPYHQGVSLAPTAPPRLGRPYRDDLAPGDPASLPLAVLEAAPGDVPTESQSLGFLSHCLRHGGGLIRPPGRYSQNGTRGFIAGREEARSRPDRLILDHDLWLVCPPRRGPPVP